MWTLRSRAAREATARGFLGHSFCQARLGARCAGGFFSRAAAAAEGAGGGGGWSLKDDVEEWVDRGMLKNLAEAISDEETGEGGHGCGARGATGSTRKAR